MKLETDKQKKDWIRKQWKFRSGDKITKMLKRYWNLENRPIQQDETEIAEEIFKDLT